MGGFNFSNGFKMFGGLCSEGGTEKLIGIQCGLLDLILTYSGTVNNCKLDFSALLEYYRKKMCT